MIQVFKKLRSIYPITENLRDYLEDNLKEDKIAKKDFLLSPGQACKNVYFVDQGLFRGYYLIGDKKISNSFFKEGEICGEVEGFLAQTKSQMYIQALEDSLVYSLTFAELQFIYKEFNEANVISRMLLERYQVNRSKRERALWMQTADARVKWFLNSFPELNKRVPAKYWASYIGITEGLLSKIKAGRYSRAERYS